MISPLLDGVWSVESRVKLLPGVHLPLRTTVLRDTHGELSLISPVRDIAAWGPEVDALGRVTNVVAPNGFHHLFLLPAAQHYPDATVRASRALRSKRPDLPDTTVWLEGDEPVTLAPGITAWPVLGMPAMREWVFLHEPSATLVVTDLLFHILDPAPLLRPFLYAFGTHRRLAMSRLFLSARRDRDAFDTSVRALLDLPFDNLVMAHGAPILGGAAERVREAVAPRLAAPAGAD